MWQAESHTLDFIVIVHVYAERMKQKTGEWWRVQMETNSVPWYVCVTYIRHMAGEPILFVDYISFSVYMAHVCRCKDIANSFFSLTLNTTSVPWNAEWSKLVCTTIIERGMTKKRLDIWANVSCIQF
jgi:membrane-bound acyltransferase YfiQ involved in biofilm formation